MAKRKLTRIEKIILIATANMTVILLVLWLMNKKTNRDFYIPHDYEGWVMIKYRIPEAPLFPVKDGVEQISIDQEGYATTSGEVEVGWRRDRFFWVNGSDTTEIPLKVRQADEYRLHIYRHKYYARSHTRLLSQLPVGTDTVLWDGTEIVKESASTVDYSPGSKSLEHFFISREAKPLSFNPPANPRSEALESTEDRSIPLN